MTTSIYEVLRDVLEAFRAQERAEIDYLNLIVRAEICLAQESLRLGAPFPNLQFVLPPQSLVLSGMPRAQSMRLETAPTTVEDRN